MKTVILFDKDRMDECLESERITFPSGLSREQKRTFILSHAHLTVPEKIHILCPNATITEIETALLNNVIDDEGNMNVHQDEVVQVRRQAGDANYYKVYNLKGDKIGKINFQNGIVSESTGANGLTNETVIAIALDRLMTQNKGKFQSVHNDDAINHLHEALKSLKLRVMDREDRGVKNTHNK